MTYTAFTDRFVIDSLPDSGQQAELLFQFPGLQYAEKLNCATELLDKHISGGRGDKVAVIGEHYSWSYSDLNAIACRIAHVLVEELGLETGNRVLLQSPNNPMLAACWLGVIKAGGVAVATMPLMRARDLKPIVEKAKIKVALCDSRLSDVMLSLQQETAMLERVVAFDGISNNAELNELMTTKSASFDTVETSASDPALIAFTSGTTGVPKGCVHFHRDIISIVMCFSENILKPTDKDIFIGSPPLAFAFGLGALLVFPLYAGASTVLIENPMPKNLAAAIEQYQASICFTSPTGYRAMAGLSTANSFSSVRLAISAGEPLPAATYKQWLEKTGISLIDGIGSTEMLHIFLSTSSDDVRVGSTGKSVPGYQVCVLDEDGQPVPARTEGLLAVKGPTNCRYLADDRQKNYVKNGWNVTGDVYAMDEDGYFWFKGRRDDMIISAGYNISGIEVENALLLHPAVAECAVIGIADEQRGSLVKACIVLRDKNDAGDDLTNELQDFVKSEIAPYKYPRAIEYISELPKTLTGKIQRFKLS